MNPQSVRIDGAEFGDVRFVAIDRWGARVVEERGDEGQFGVFVDVPEVGVGVRVVQGGDAELVDAPALGDEVELEFVRSRNASSRGRQRVSVAGVVTRVSHGQSARSGLSRVIEIRAVSADGSADPVSIDSAE